MLYECWLQVARSRPSEVAMVDLSQGTRWTFSELQRAVDKQFEAEQDEGSGGAICFPSDRSGKFVIDVLKAWRAGKVVCPLEPGQPQPAPLTSPVPSQVVHLKTTSATTGLQRVVAFKAAQLKADVDNIVQTMGLRPDWPNLGVISLAHSYGFSNLVLPLLLHGIPLVLAPSTLPEALRSAAKFCAEFTLAAVPALWSTWCDAEVIPPNIRLAISAGAPLGLEVEALVCERFGLKIHNFYGSSECGGIGYDRNDQVRSDGACVGSPMVNVQVEIADDGCVEVRSAAVGETYWPEPSSKLQGGRFRTSDLGEVADNLIYLRGRASDQINVAGRKVRPEEIERVLTAHPQVRACLVFGVPSLDSQRGETIVACVAGNQNITGDVLRQFAMPQLPAWQVPRDWWFVDSLGVNERGKLSRAEWRKRYLETARNRSLRAD